MVIRSDFTLQGPPCVTLESRSLGEHMMKRLQEHGHNVAQIDAISREEQLFSEILRKSLLLGAGLQSLGVQQGDVVGIISENSLSYVLPVLGTLYVGASCAPYNPSYTPRELQHSLALSQPKIVFSSTNVEDTLVEALKNISFKVTVIVMGENKHYDHHIAMESLTISGGDRNNFLPYVVKEPTEEVAFIMCSSGTTGLPKGVMLTHSNILHSLLVLQHPDIMAVEDVGTVIGYLPFFHSFGMNGLLQTLHMGLVTVVMPQFAPDTFLQVIQDFKIRMIRAVPPIIAFLAKHPMVSEYNLSSLERVGCGAAPLSRDLQEQLIKRFPHIIDIAQGYGLTEATLGILVTPKNLNKFGSSGTLVPGMEAKVLEMETGKVLGPGNVGELCFRGCMIMKGYVNDPAATAATIDSQGWLHSGDIGYYDEDGYFYIIDRLKELIKYKGFQVAPAELEALLLTHPAVQEAAVVGIPDDDAGELPRAFIVKQDEVTADEILTFVAREVSPHKRLRGGVQFVDEIPKNPSGKILRRELRQQLKSKL